MPHRLLAPFALAVLLFLPTALQAAAPAPPWQGKLSACPLPGGNGETLCGTYEVFEDRDARAGRKIPLRIVVLPATGAERAPDPVFFISGGPGEAATVRVAQRLHSPLRAHRDLILVDVRGTAGSNPLSCPIWGDGTRLDHIFPLDAAAACRDELQKRADLTRYTTIATVDDLDEVRRYLGYGKVNVIGNSYGTSVAQVFLTRHPEAVRSIVLSGVVKPGDPAPLYHARNAQQALELLARDCAAEPACHAAFPRFREEFSAALDRLAQEPVRVQVTNPATGKPAEVRLTRSAAAEVLRYALYDPQDASRVPRQIHLAAQGDYRALAKGAVELRAQIQRRLALGLLFSVTCAEDLPRIDPQEIPVATRGTFYGDDRVRDQLAVCAIWPHGPLPPGAGALVRSDVPALLLSGERDPVTPPADAAQVAQGFPHGLWVPIAHGAHNNAGDCESRVVAEFVERGSVQGLDVACLKTAQPVPFVTKDEPEPSASGKLSPCPGGAGEALCGTYEVFEDRAARAGRKIPLRIVVLPATGPERAPDPVFLLSGGPGEAAADQAPDFVRSALRGRRDLVFVDVRGTGGSNPLSCRLWGDGTRLDHIFPLDAATACRDELRQRADLTRYTTAAAMDDVDEVRRHLGYAKVNLIGGSYGTYAAQVFLTRHPEAVRSVVLSGVVKPGQPSPLYHARNSQQALELLARDCASEPACHAAFPHFLAEVSAVLDRLAREPVRVPVPDPATGKPVEVRLTRSAAAEAIRFALYNPQGASLVPRVVHLAAQGDFRELARDAVQIRAELQGELALGLLFSVTCAEDLPRIDPQEIPAATRGTFYGDDRVRDQLAVCAIWPHAPLPPGAGALVHSDVPALLLSGERDPVTPPADAAQVAKGFPHGLWVQIPHGAHSGAGDCRDRVAADFMERGSAQGLDVACLKTAQPVPFVTKDEPEPSASRP